jgi:hypothetical protein
VRIAQKKRILLTHPTSHQVSTFETKLTRASSAEYPMRRRKRFFSVASSGFKKDRNDSARKYAQAYDTMVEITIIKNGSRISLFGIVFLLYSII